MGMVGPRPSVFEILNSDQVSGLSQKSVVASCCLAVDIDSEVNVLPLSVWDK